MNVRINRAPSQVQVSRQAMQRFQIRAEVQKKYEEIRAVERSELEEYAKAVDATMLWTLHTEYGFGKKRLRKFWENLVRTRIEFRGFYRGEFSASDEGEDRTGNTVEDHAFIAALRNIGVDLLGWEAETFKVDEVTGEVKFIEKQEG